MQEGGAHPVTPRSRMGPPIRLRAWLIGSTLVSNGPRPFGDPRFASVGSALAVDFHWHGVE